MEITYRPATLEDLEPATRLVADAYNDLRSRHGLTSTIVARPPLFARFCFMENADGFSIAEDDGRTVGFGFAWTRQRFWYLAQLFVAPCGQGKGIGQGLMSRTLELAERSGAENRSLITMAYNTVSTGLYIRNGLYPREPLLRMVASAPALQANIGAGGLDAVPIEPWTESRAWLDAIDEQVLGFRRESHHAFLLGGFAAQAVRIERAGRPVGYAYISAEGHIGPLAIMPGADQADVVLAAVRCALERQPKHVSMMVPGRADRILGAVSGLGFRIDEPFVVLSAGPFGDWANYLPSNPGLM